MATIEEIRAKHPEYADLTDEQLADGLHKKFYSDMPFEDFVARIGAQPRATAPSRDIPARQARVATPRAPANILEAAGNALTQWGDVRTRAQRGVGEAAFASIPENPAIRNPVSRFIDAQGAANAVGWGLFWNRDEADRAEIIRKNIPTAQFRRDEYGNLQVRYRPDRPWTYINRPGASLQDVQGFANDMVKFAPAARAGIAAQGAARASGASGVISAGAGAAAAGGASAATEGASRAAAMPVGGSAPTVGDVTAAGGGGALGHVGGNLIAAGARRLMMTPDERAAEIIGRRVSEAGLRTKKGAPVRGDEALREVERRAARVRSFPGRTAETVAEVSGTPGQSMARAVANVPGPGKEIARNAVESRATGRLADDLSPIEGGASGAPGAMDRVGSISSRTLEQARGALTPDDGPKTFSAAAEALDEEIRTTARNLYAAARSTPIDQNAARSVLIPHMRDAPRGVLSSAQRQLGDEARAVKIQIDEARMSGVDDVAQLQSYLNALEEASGQMARIVNGEETALSPLALEYFQKGLSQAESALSPGVGQSASPEFRQITIVRENFNTLADRIAPALGTARSAYAHGQRVREAMEQGRKVFEMRPEEVAQFLNPVNRRTGKAGSITKEEFQGFMYGALDEIERKLQRNETVFVLQFLRNRGWQEALVRFLGKDGAKALRSRLAREGGMQRFRNFTQSGSQTTPLAEDIKAMTEDQPGLDFLGDVAASGGVQGPVMKRMAETYQRLRRPGIYDENVNRAVAERLYAPATKENVDALMRDVRGLRLYQDGSVEQFNGFVRRLEAIRAQLVSRMNRAKPGKQRNAIQAQIARLDEVMARAKGARGVAVSRQGAVGAGAPVMAPQGEPQSEGDID